MIDRHRCIKKHKINFISLVSQYRLEMSKNVLLFSVFDRSWCVVFATDINLASLVKQFSGRKRGSSVWTYSKFEETENKSRCLVALANGAKCDAIAATKNPTNLKNHLSITTKKFLMT